VPADPPPACRSACRRVFAAARAAHALVTHAGPAPPPQAIADPRPHDAVAALDHARRSSAALASPTARGAAAAALLYGGTGPSYAAAAPGAGPTAAKSGAQQTPFRSARHYALAMRRLEEPFYACARLQAAVVRLALTLLVAPPGHAMNALYFVPAQAVGKAAPAAQATSLPAFTALAPLPPGAPLDCGCRDPPPADPASAASRYAAFLRDRRARGSGPPRCGPLCTCHARTELLGLHGADLDTAAPPARYRYCARDLWQESLWAPAAFRAVRHLPSADSAPDAPAPHPHPHHAFPCPRHPLPREYRTRLERGHPSSLGVCGFSADVHALQPLPYAVGIRPNVPELLLAHLAHPANAPVAAALASPHVHALASVAAQGPAHRHADGQLTRSEAVSAAPVRRLLRLLSPAMLDAGRFRTARDCLVGKGRFGVVLRALDAHSQTPVALKVTHLPLCGSAPSAIPRVFTEVTALHRLAHAPRRIIPGVPPPDADPAGAPPTGLFGPPPLDPLSPALWPIHAQPAKAITFGVVQPRSGPGSTAALASDSAAAALFGGGGGAGVDVVGADTASSPDSSPGSAEGPGAGDASGSVSSAAAAHVVLVMPYYELTMRAVATRAADAPLEDRLPNPAVYGPGIAGAAPPSPDAATATAPSSAAAGGLTAPATRARDDGSVCGDGSARDDGSVCGDGSARDNGSVCGEPSVWRAVQRVAARAACVCTACGAAVAPEEQPRAGVSVARLKALLGGVAHSLRLPSIANVTLAALPPALARVVSQLAHGVCPRAACTRAQMIWALRACEAVLWQLQASHDAGVLHLDVKADNVMLRALRVGGAPAWSLALVDHGESVVLPWAARVRPPTPGAYLGTGDPPRVWPGPPAAPDSVGLPLVTTVARGTEHAQSPEMLRLSSTRGVCGCAQASHASLPVVAGATSAGAAAPSGGRACVCVCVQQDADLWALACMLAEVTTGATMPPSAAAAAAAPAPPQGPGAPARLDPAVCSLLGHCGPVAGWLRRVLQPRSSRPSVLAALELLQRAQGLV
jgi:serine/threonine protein kinase